MGTIDGRRRHRRRAQALAAAADAPPTDGASHRCGHGPSLKRTPRPRIGQPNRPTCHRPPHHDTEVVPVARTRRTAATPTCRRRSNSPAGGPVRLPTSMPSARPRRGPEPPGRQTQRHRHFGGNAIAMARRSHPASRRSSTAGHGSSASWNAGPGRSTRTGQWALSTTSVLVAPQPSPIGDHMALCELPNEQRPHTRPGSRRHK